jgi:hypothetical protein
MSLMVLEVYNHNVFEKFGRKIKRTIVWVERHLSLIGLISQGYKL